VYQRTGLSNMEEETPTDGACASSDVVPTLSHSVLPVPRIDRVIRKRYRGRRVSPGVAVYTTAALENIFTEVIRAAKSEAVASKKKRITKENLVAAVRTHPSLCRIFRSYAFSSAVRLPYKSVELMTKYDRETRLKAREEKKVQMKANAVPGVDED